MKLLFSPFHAEILDIEVVEDYPTLSSGLTLLLTDECTHEYDLLVQGHPVDFVNRSLCVLLLLKVDVSEPSALSGFIGCDL